MTSTPVSNLAQAQSPPVMISKTGKLWIILIGALMVAFHWHFVRRMVLIAIDDANWSHILIIPLISAYYIHLNRHKLMAAPRRVCTWGLPFIVFGMVGYTLSKFPLRVDMAMGYSMIITLFGIVLLMLGPKPMKVLWFPIAYMVFAVKVSESVWSKVASVMQTIAAKGAVLLLEVTSGITGLDAELTGSRIDLYFGQPNAPTALNVAEACAGMRMLMAFLALGVALAFLFPRKWWQRTIMIAMAAPIAIFVNILRVAVLGWIHLIDPSKAHGDSHLFIGMLMLIPAAGLLMLVGWCLDKVIITNNTKQKHPAPTPFNEDPAALHFDKPTQGKGAVLGLGVGLALGTAMVLAVNYLTLDQNGVAQDGSQLVRGIVFPFMNTGINLALLGVTALLFAGGFAFAALKIGQRSYVNTKQLALAQSFVAGLLLISFLGQSSVLNVIGVALNKKPVPLRHGIALHFPRQAGGWELLHQDAKLPKDVEDELGTTEYINNWYINNANGYSTENISANIVDTDLGPRLAGWSAPIEPGNIAKIHMTYYTGMLDTIPHVPDKCWIVNGQQQLYREVHTLNLAREDYRPDPDHPGMILAESTGFDQTVRLPSDELQAIIFSAADEEGNITTAMYFFMANGDQLASNTDVRLSFEFADRYSYYSKVEVLMPGLNVTDAQSAEVYQRYAEDLLSDLMPEIMACLPDWTEVQAGQYPEESDEDVNNNTDD